MIKGEENMISSNLILALGDVIKRAPLVITIACAVVAAIAFLVGFTKGFRRVGWGCLTCLVATVVFILFNRILVKSKLVLNINMNGALDERALTTFLVATVSIVLTLVVYGLLSWLLRPSYKIVHRNPVSYKYGIEIEDDYSEYDDVAEPRFVEWKHAGRPTIVGRLIGGTICAINTLGILAIVVSVVLIVINATMLGSTELSAAMNVRATKIMLDFAQKYALDFITISAIVLMAFKGYKNGLVGSIRSLVVSYGGTILGILAFVLPFMNSGMLFFTPKLVQRCTSLLGGVPEMFRALAGKLLAGVLIFAFFMILLALVNYLLGRLSYVVIRLKPIRMLDGSIACFLYFLLGVIVCIGVWCLFYALDYCGLLHISEAFSEESSLAGSLFKLAETWVKPVIDKFVVQ